MRGEESSNDLPSLVTLAHELKSPLALIRQLALAREYYDDKEVQAALSRIELTAQRSLRLVEALTNGVRPNDFAMEPVHLGQVCEEIAHELAPLAKAKNHILELTVPHKPVLAVGNRELVSSIVFGLCDNALQYDTTHQPVTLQVTRIKENGRIAVDDHAPRLETSLRSQLGDQPVTPGLRAGRSGLGLYIASQFARQMQGNLGLRRHHHGGHMFYLDLPRSTQLSLLT